MISSLSLVCDKDFQFHWQRRRELRLQIIRRNTMRVSRENNRAGVSRFKQNLLFFFFITVKSDSISAAMYSLSIGNFFLSDVLKRERNMALRERVLSPASILHFFPPQTHPFSSAKSTFQILWFLLIRALTYEITDPIWILEIKMSDSVQRSCSRLRRQSKEARRGRKGKKENGKFAAERGSRTERRYNSVDCCH